MKKLSVLLFLAAFLLPMAIGAKAPARIDLQPNQRLLGHYTTDSIVIGGCWGRPTGYGNVYPIATDLTPEELAIFQGGKIVAFRVGLSQTAPVSRVFVIPHYADNTWGEVTEWPCEVSDEGWNIVELVTPYLIDLPSDARLRIGFDYIQLNKDDKPISAVQVGTIYPTEHYNGTRWADYHVSSKGNLSLQCIVEKDNFQDYAVRMRNLKTARKNLKAGDALSFTFELCSVGDVQILAGGCVMEVAIDGQVIKTISNPETLTPAYATFTNVITTAGLAEGEHTLTLSIATINGEPIADPISISCTFKTFDYGFTRQMHLVEQFTSTECMYCPQGSARLQTLSDMRGDVAWVGVHQILSSDDPLRTVQGDTIARNQGCGGYPEASFDRSVGVESANSVIASINSHSASHYNSFLDYLDENPAWATVNINSTFDAGTRQAVITINGDLVQGYEHIMGTDSKLTVYITEDGVVSPQNNNGVMINNYVHNGVLRKALGSAKGVNLKTTDDAYKNVFNVAIPQEWNADNLNIVAFISRPLGNPKTDIYVTNTNKRKLGEFDQPAILPGDINGDTTVDVADVVALIDIILNEIPFDITVADINGDTSIDVADVVALIDIILNGD